MRHLHDHATCMMRDHAGGVTAGQLAARTAGAAIAQTALLDIGLLRVWRRVHVI